MDKGKVSIITSMFNSEDYIKEFMDNVIHQTAFKDCELILVDANKTREDRFIDKELSNHSNIKYFHIEDFGLHEDPGVYGCWNLAIKNSSGEFITNMNLDDSRCETAISEQRSSLMSSPEIDLVYYRTLETKIKGETFKNNTTDKEFPCLDHCLNSLRIINSPHCQPMWRRSIHDRFGMFNDSLMSAGDYEMWLRSVDGGAKMKKIDKVLGLYFRNPDGVSTSSKTLQKALFEVNQVKNQYSRSYI